MLKSGMTVGNKLLVIILVVFLTACGGGEGFVPDVGPYTGTFKVNGVDVGTISFTANGGLISGTGTLMHNDQMVAVSISALIQGSTMNGTMENTALGSGGWTGSFNGRHASGTFNYTDRGAISTTSGTWAVSRE